MANAVSALRGERFKGLAEVRDLGLRGMITVRGDLASGAFRDAVAGVAGVEFPDRRGANISGEAGLLWMSPDEVMVLAPYAEVAARHAALETTLSGMHHLVADVSDARSLIELSGEHARDVLARLTPADLRPSSFGLGEVRRTRLAQVPAAFWMKDAMTIEIVCFRSASRYVFDLLAYASRDTKATGVF